MHPALPSPITAHDIATRLDATLIGDPSTTVCRLASLEGAQGDALSFITHKRYLTAARQTLAAIVLVDERLAPELSHVPVRLLVPDPYVAYALVSQWFAQLLAGPDAAAGIHPTAILAQSAQLGSKVRVEAGAVIGERTVIGADCQIGPGCSIGRGVTMGSGCRLDAGVVLYDGITLGDRVIIHSGAVIGADGFGFAPSKQGFVKIAQLGSVRIGDDVEIGANTTIDRGALDDTVIGKGCKLDNQVQIGHNVQVGEHTVIAGCTGIAGSAVIGSRCMIGGGVGMVGHLRICDDVIIGGMAMVDRPVTEPGYYSGGWPLQAHAQWERSAVLLKQLPALRQRIRSLSTLVGLPKDPS